MFRRLLKRLSGRTGMDVPLIEMPPGTVGAHSYGPTMVRHFTVNGGLRVGKYCSFAADTEILLGGNHRHDWVTTFPFPNRDPRFAHLPPAAATKGDVVIGNDVWLGRGATILSGVTIGDGAVIGARALIARNVAPYAIVTGNPGTFVRLRFPEHQVAALLRIRWWDWDDERVARAAPLLMQPDIARFIAAAEAGEV